MSITNAERDQILALAGKLGITPTSAATTPTPIAETIPRSAISIVTSIGTLTSATLYMFAVSLPQGAVVSALSVLSGTTAESSGTHAWLALYDSSRNLLASGADNTAAAAVGASAVFTQSMQVPYTATYSGLYYIGICVVATTPPTLSGIAGSTTWTGIAPVLAASSSTGLVGTPPNPAAALTAFAGVAYAYVS